MRLHVESFWMPRAGKTEAEYEDAFHEERELAPGVVRVAVADGANETPFSRRWAQTLVGSFCRVPALDYAATLAAARDDWERWLDESPPPPEQATLADEALATLLGLELRGDGGAGRWTALVVGDSCLFQLRRDELLTAIPLERSDQFGSAPDLVPTRPSRVDLVDDRAILARGDWRAGDVFYLATDTLAASFLRACEVGAAPWGELHELCAAGTASFVAWVDELRSAGTMRNDDVTLVRVDVR